MGNGIIRKELKRYDVGLKTKPQIIALNKIDLLSEEIKEKTKILKKEVDKNQKVFAIFGLLKLALNQYRISFMKIF